MFFFFFQAEDGIRDLVRSRGLGDVYKRQVVTIGENGYTLDDILVHDAHNPNPGLHVMLTNMNLPDFPVALGVIRAVKHSTYDDNVRDQLLDVQKNAKIKCMDDLLHSGDTYEMK